MSICFRILFIVSYFKCYSYLNRSCFNYYRVFIFIVVLIVLHLSLIICFCSLFYFLGLRLGPKPNFNPCCRTSTRISRSSRHTHKPSLHPFCFTRPAWPFSSHACRRPHDMVVSFTAPPNLTCGHKTMHEDMHM